VFAVVSEESACGVFFRPRHENFVSRRDLVHRRVNRRGCNSTRTCHPALNHEGSFRHGRIRSRGDVPLLFTGQVFAGDHSGDARSQADRALQALGATLVKAGADLSRVVRLTGYVADDKSMAGVEAAIAARFADAAPAVTLVRTPLSVRCGRCVQPWRRVPGPAAVESSIPPPPSARGRKDLHSGRPTGNRPPPLRLTMAGLPTVAHLTGRSRHRSSQGLIKPVANDAVALGEVAASRRRGRSADGDTNG
jgi:enamine deaminase RidA (YjgF/YER057c/UK114 family)